MAFANAASQTVADFQVPRLNNTVLISTSIPFARAPALTAESLVEVEEAAQVFWQALADVGEEHGEGFVSEFQASHESTPDRI